MGFKSLDVLCSGGLKASPVSLQSGLDGVQPEGRPVDLTNLGKRLTFDMPRGYSMDLMLEEPGSSVWYGLQPALRSDVLLVLMNHYGVGTAQFCVVLGFKPGA